MALVISLSKFCLLVCLYYLLHLSVTKAQHPSRRFGAKLSASGGGGTRRKSAFELLNSQFAAEAEIEPDRASGNVKSSYGSVSASSGDTLSDFLEELGQQNLDGLGMLRRLVIAVQDLVGSAEVRDFFESGAFRDAMQQGAAALDGEAAMPTPLEAEGVDEEEEVQELLNTARKQAKDVLQSTANDYANVYKSINSYISFAMGLIDQLQSARGSPRRMRKALSAVPEAAREIVELLTQLDHATVYSAIVNAVRELHPSEQAMLSKVVGGDLRGFASMLKTYLRNDEQKIAQIYSYVSENQAAFSMIPKRVLEDKLMFKLYLLQSLDEMSNPKTRDPPAS